MDGLTLACFLIGCAVFILAGLWRERFDPG